MNSKSTLVDRVWLDIYSWDLLVLDGTREELYDPKLPAGVYRLVWTL